MSRLTLVRHVESVVIAAATILLVLPVRAEMNAASTQAVEGASAVPFVAQDLHGSIRCNGVTIRQSGNCCDARAG